MFDPFLSNPQYLTDALDDEEKQEQHGDLMLEAGAQSAARQPSPEKVLPGNESASSLDEQDEFSWYEE